MVEVQRRTCLNCGRKTQTQPARELCWKCWKDKAVRHQYPLLAGKYSNRRKAPCRHCERIMFVQGRALCGTCYYIPEVRSQYPRIGNRPYSRNRKQCC